MEQVIKITVPDGKRAVYDDATNTIKFIPIKDYTNIKTFRDVCEALNEDYDEIMAELNNTSVISLADKAKIMLRMTLMAVNGDHKFSMVKGAIYYPYIYMVRDSDYATFKSKNRNSFSDGSYVEIANYVYEGTTYYLVGGHAYLGTFDGLAYFDSYSGVGHSSARIGFMRCKSRPVAEHVSKFFGALVWDAMYADDLGFALASK